ncbi:MAG TPA: hypothetical protein DCX89_05720 [Saprospirales bacterium]|nr:hypothetical protein [Saprospirales bacterium]
MAANIVRKLFSLSLWNTSAAAINFVANVLIARILGIDVFGEFAYLSSLAALFSLIFIVIPPNYAIMRYQDDEKFKFVFTSFFILINVLLIIPVLIFQHLTQIPFWLFYIFVFSTSFQIYMDTCLQAENKLNHYYFLIFAQALIKIILLGFMLLPGWISDFEGLILIISFAQFVIAIYFIVNRLTVFVESLKYFGQMFRTILAEINSFYPYYFNISLKKLDSNIIILLFEPLVSKEVLGVYSLITKVFQFITGLVRTAESLFLFKKYIQKYQNSFIKNAFFISAFLQFSMILVGLIYMKSTAGSYYTFWLILLSFLMYPYVFFIKARAFFLSLYKNFHINISYALFLLPPSICFIIFQLTDLNLGLNELILMLFSSSLLQMIYLVIMEKRFKSSFGKDW